MFRTIRVLFKVIVYMLKKQKLLKQVKKLEKEGKEQEVKEKIAPLVIDWAKYCVDATGSTIEVTGIENVPADKSVVYIGNHQGIFDIPLLLGYIPYQKAFISKIEILKIPMISDWMKLMKCVFLARKNPRQSIEAMHQGIENVKNGLVFSKDGDKIWKCRNCGHIVIGKRAPEMCPVCSHPKSFFEIKAENY